MPTEIVSRWRLCGVASSVAALRAAASWTVQGIPDQADVLDAGDLALFLPSLVELQGTLAAKLGAHIGTPVEHAMTACMGAPADEVRVMPVLVPVDGESAPRVVPAVAFRYFAVPESYQYVLFICVRVVSTDENPIVVADPGNAAPVIVRIFPAIPAPTKRPREPTYT